MEAVRIDLSKYVHTGEGAVATSYDSTENPDEMVKFYNASTPADDIITEVESARKVYSLGIPSPKPGELVTDGERLGIRFRKISGKRSISRMISQEPERAEEYAREFARLCKYIHNIEVPEGMFTDAKEQLHFYLDSISDYNAAEKAVIAKAIDALPDCRTALHGDLHSGNVITTLPKGAPLDTPHDSYFIDLGYFSYGTPLLDVGMYMSQLLFSNEQYIMDTHHFGAELAAKVWEYFEDEYFFAADNLAEKYFGKGQTHESVREALTPYFCLKSLMIGYVVGHMLPEQDALVRKYLLQR